MVLLMLNYVGLALAGHLCSQTVNLGEYLYLYIVYFKALSKQQNQQAIWCFDAIIVLFIIY